MTDEQIREILARHTKAEFTMQELESLLVAAKGDLLTAGATTVDIRRAASYLTDDVMQNAGIPHRARAAMLPVFEKVFGEHMTAFRARVAADEAAWHAMKAGDVSDDEIDQYLVRGHRGVKGLGWRVLGWIALVVVAWQYSGIAAGLALVAPVVLFVIKTFVRVRSKRPKVGSQSQHL